MALASTLPREFSPCSTEGGLKRRWCARRGCVLRESCCKSLQAGPAALRMAGLLCCTAGEAAGEAVTLCCPTCEAVHSSEMGAMPSSPCCSPCVPDLAPVAAQDVLVRLPPATDCRLLSGDGRPTSVDPEAAVDPRGVSTTAAGTRPGPLTGVDLGLISTEPPAEAFGLRAAKDWRRGAMPFREEGELLSTAAICMDPQVCEAWRL